MDKTGYKIIDNGSITSPTGFSASGVIAGLKASGLADMALVYSEKPAEVSAAFTQNSFVAAPVVYDQKIVAMGSKVRAVLINSGNANACTGKSGYDDVLTTTAIVANRLGIKAEEVLISSTGRIGVSLPMDKITAGIKVAVDNLDNNAGHNAAKAIMTTDTKEKSFAVSVTIDGINIGIGGMTKGAGMIAPKLRLQPPQATMLAYVTTDANISREALDDVLNYSLDQSFNRITVDGDTSTNDTFMALSNGMANNAKIERGTPQFKQFKKAFTAVVSHLAKEMVLDGEGVSKFVELTVCGAKNYEQARRCAESIANSALCKTAWFGADPNWGRILCAAGYAGVEIDTNNIDLWYDKLPIISNGLTGCSSEETQTEILKQSEFSITLNLAIGDASFTIWTCDLSYEYVKINADYHT